MRQRIENYLSVTVEGVDLDFADSDHNPVLTSVKLK